MLTMKERRFGLRTWATMLNTAGRGLRGSRRHVLRIRCNAVGGKTRWSGVRLALLEID